jgi:aconitate hydratase
MKPGNKNSFNSKSTININNKDYTYYSISEAEKNGLEGVSKLPKVFEGSVRKFIKV